MADWDKLATRVRVFIGGVEFRNVKSINYSDSRAEYFSGTLDEAAALGPKPIAALAGHFPHLPSSPAPMPVAETAAGFRRCPSCRLDVLASEFLGASCVECLKETR